MYSVRVYFVHPRKGLIVRYLTYDTYTMASDAIRTLEGRDLRKEYPKELYLEVATVSHTAIGELMPCDGIECEELKDYLHKAV